MGCNSSQTTGNEDENNSKVVDSAALENDFTGAHEINDDKDDQVDVSMDAASRMENSKGDEAFAEAERILKKKGMFNGEETYTRASEKFSQAGKSYSLAKNFHKAFLSYKEAARCAEQLDDRRKYMIAHYSVEGAKVGLEVEDDDLWEECLELYQKAARTYEETSKLQQAAITHKELANILAENRDRKEAIDHYESAKHFYECEGRERDAAMMTKNIADMSCLLLDYAKAASALDSLIEGHRDGNVSLRGQMLTYMMKSLLCLLASQDDVVNSTDIVETKLEQYEDKLVAFSQGSEATFIRHVLEAVKADDSTAMKQKVQRYNKAYSLDKSSMKLLISIRKKLPSFKAADAKAQDKIARYKARQQLADDDDFTGAQEDENANKDKNSNNSELGIPLGDDSLDDGDDFR